MNAVGLRLSGRVQLALAVTLALLMVVTMSLALPHGDADHLSPFAPNGWGPVAGAAAVLVWGFAGWEAVAPLSGEYRNPRRDVPRATAIAVAVVGLLYLGLAATSLLVLGPATGQSEAPLSDLMAVALGDGARVLTAVAAVLLTLGAMNAYFAGGSGSAPRSGGTEASPRPWPRAAARARFRDAASACSPSVARSRSWSWPSSTSA